MEHEEMYEPIEQEQSSDETDTAVLPFAVAPAATDEIECTTDMECPSGMVCEAVSCCQAEGCHCPDAVCAWSDTGAQGRDCESADDCGIGYGCNLSEATACGESSDESCTESPIGWCNADGSDSNSAMPYPDESADAIDEASEELTGCQGGADTGLPIVFALALFAATLSRRRQLS